MEVLGGTRRSLDPQGRSKTCWHLRSAVTASCTEGSLPRSRALREARIRSVADWLVEALEADGWPIVSTSAKTGDEVEGLFESLASRMTAF